MNIHNLETKIENVFNDQKFIIMLESHLTYLRSIDKVKIVQITEHQNYKYEGDLYGLLDDLGINKKFHFVISRINGYESSCDFKGNREYLAIPDLSEITLLKNIYQTKNN